MFRASYDLAAQNTGLTIAKSSTPETLSKMRIAIVITELHPGGAEKCCVQLAIYLKRLGHAVTVLQLWPEPPADKRALVDMLDKFEIPWKSAGAVRPLDFFRATQWLKRELRTFAPDVVQSFLLHANFAVALARHSFRGPFFGGARVRQPEWLRQKLQRWSARRMTRLICVSRSVETHCRSVEHIPAELLTTIPNGIEIPTVTRIASPAAADLPTNTPYLLFVGRLVPQKGIELLIQRADELLEQLPKHHLICIGEGLSRPQLESIKQAARHEPRIHLPGWQPDPLAWMTHCDALLLPAAYEGMPNVVLEAMSVRRPVVAFDVEGIDELLGEDMQGRLQRISPSDMSAFISTCVAIGRDAQLADQLGTRNLLRAEAHFQLEEQLAKYLTLYQRHCR